MSSAQTFHAGSFNGQDAPDRRESCGFESRASGHFPVPIAQRTERAFRDKSGDEGSIPSGDAFDAQAARLRPWLLSLAAKWTGKSYSVDLNDLVQVGMITLWQRFPSYDPARGSLLNYADLYVRAAMKEHVYLMESVVRVPMDKWKDGLKAQTESFEAETDDENPLHNTLTGGPQPDDEVCQKEVKALLIAALQRLRPRQREIMTRYYFGHESTPVIARALGISRQAVCQQVRDALRELRRFLPTWMKGDAS